jgi:hypothetical protein
MRPGTAAPGLQEYTFYGSYVLKTGRLSQPSRTELEIEDLAPIIDGRLTIDGISGKADDMLAEMAKGVRVYTGDTRK